MRLNIKFLRNDTVLLFIVHNMEGSAGVMNSM